MPEPSRRQFGGWEHPRDDRGRVFCAGCGERITLTGPHGAMHSHVAGSYHAGCEPTRVEVAVVPR